MTLTHWIVWVVANGLKLNDRFIGEVSVKDLALDDDGAVVDMSTGQVFAD